MAQFLKVPAGPVAGDGIETLINIAEIGGVTSIANANSVTTLIIQMRNPKTAGTYTIKVPGAVGGATGFTAAERVADLAKEYNKALTANPGGIVSTLGSVVQQKQAPAAQTGLQGRQPITKPLVMAQYTTCIYAV